MRFTILFIIQYLPGSQYHIHKVRSLASHTILTFLPDERIRHQFRQVGTNQDCSRSNSTRYIRTIGAIHPISHCCRIRSDTGSKRDRVTSRMATQDKVDCIENIVWCEQIWISILQEAVIITQSLHIQEPELKFPRSSGDAVWSLQLHFHTGHER